MKIGKRLLLVTLLFPVGLLAQGPPPEGVSNPGEIMAKTMAQGPGGPPMQVTVSQMGGVMGPQLIVRNTDMGEWWQNSQIAQKLKLSDEQVQKLSNVFYQHRLKLIDYQAEVEKQNLMLQNLLDQDNPNEKTVLAQVDKALSARSNVEREFTMMNLDLRKVLTVDQWKQLKAIQSERVRTSKDVFFYRQMGDGPGPQALPPPPMVRGGQRLDPR
jgi:Spy/CpxP family protein refolding chaperone